MKGVVFHPLDGEVFVKLTGAGTVTSGGHTVQATARNQVYADAGDTSAGDWQSAAALYYAASDGTTIGAWQVPEPATMSLLVIGGIALLRRKRR